MKSLIFVLCLAVSGVASAQQKPAAGPPPLIDRGNPETLPQMGGAVVSAELVK